MSCVHRSRRSPTRVLCAATSLALPACSASLPFPPTGPIPPDALVEVPYPPPAAHVETVPAQKGSRDVWLDGQWEWAGNAWRWLAGTWMTPPANAYYTPWQTVRSSDGRLFFARAAWRGQDGRALDVAAGPGVCSAAPGAHAGAAITAR
jgi:hypothetical protein